MILYASYSPPDGTPVIGCSHPGHMGDALWSLPACRELAHRHNCKVDFWTSRVCEPVADLIDAQDFVRNVVCDPGQRVEGGGGGVQPWHVANMEGPGNEYIAHYHFGFRSEITVPIPEYCCRLYGLPQLPTRYDLPIYHATRGVPPVPFVATAYKGEDDNCRNTFREVVQRSPHPVVEVGGIGQAVGTDLGAIDRTSKGFLEMAWIISQCRWFVGLMSAPLVVAAGFPCVKIVAVDAVHHGDMRHVIRTPLHHYVGYDANAILERIR